MLPSKTRNPKLRNFKFLWLAYAFFIIYGTIIPFNLVPLNEKFISNFSTISWIPFIDPDGSRASIPDVVQNILLFLPFGFLSFLSMHQRRRQRIFLATLLGSLLSIFVEILQLFTIDRTTSATDLATNTAGALLGALAASLMLDIISKAITFHSLQKYIRIKSFFPFLIASILVAAGAFQPFDFTLDVGSLWTKIKFLVYDPMNYKYVISDEGVVFIRLGLLALVSVICLQEWSYRQPTMKGIVLSSLIGLALEGCQIIIESRMPSMQDAAVVILSCICGGLLARHWPRLISTSILAIIMIAATWIAAMLNALSPFSYTAVYKSMNWFPFLPYYDRTSFMALSNFIESVLIYYPMGFVLAYFFDRKKSLYIFIAIIAGLIALPLELLQGWIDGRYPDITDVLGALFGAVSGAWTCREGWKAFERNLEYSLGTLPHRR